MSKTMVIKPKMSEKAYALSQLVNTYVFDVPTTANKVTVAAAVESRFDVVVEEVRIVVVKGKVKKSYQKRNRPVDGKRAKAKKAYVRLAEGSSINLFGDEEAKDDKKTKESKKSDSKEIKSATKSTSTNAKKEAK